MILRIPHVCRQVYVEAMQHMYSTVLFKVSYSWCAPRFVMRAWVARLMPGQRGAIARVELHSRYPACVEVNGPGGKRTFRSAVRYVETERWKTSRYGRAIMEGR